MVAACDLPTQLPRYDTAWDVVAVRDSIATGDLLPEGMRATREGFVIDSFSHVAEVRLGDVCELCTCFQGPIPSLEIAPHDWPIRPPAGVMSAELESGTAHVVIHNEVGFDLLDDGEGRRGFLQVALTDVSTDDVLGTTVLAEPFPPGDSVALDFDLGGIELDRNLVARVSGFIPGTGCDTIPLTPESGFRTRVELRNVVAEAVEVWVSDAALALPKRSFDLPSALAGRLRSGEARITVEVAVENRLPADVEIGVSAAGREGDLFGEGAALYTPILIPTGTPEQPGDVRRVYVVNPGPIGDAGHLHLATRNRFLSSRLLRLYGGESVAFQVRLRAEVPSR